MICKRSMMLWGLLLVVIGAGSAPAADGAWLQTKEGKLSYSIGVDLARNMKRLGIEVEADALVQGIRDGLAVTGVRLGDEEIHQALEAYQNELKLKRATAKPPSPEEVEKTRRAGEAFLAENQKKEGVVVLPSGLQYLALKTGTGPKPAFGDMVQCQFRSSLIDGTEVVNTFRNDQPATIKIAKSVPGMAEALQRMPVGSRWRLFLPPKLAYGPNSSGTKIGPETTLIIEIELLGVLPPGPGPEPQVRKE